MRRPENIRDIQADVMVISSLVSESNGGFNCVPYTIDRFFFYLDIVLSHLL